MSSVLRLRNSARLVTDHAALQIVTKIFPQKNHFPKVERYQWIRTTSFQSGCCYYALPQEDYTTFVIVVGILFIVGILDFYKTGQF